MRSTEWAKRLIAEELASVTEVTGPLAAQIVAKLDRHRLLREFYYDGETIDRRTDCLPK